MYRIGELARRTQTSADLLRAWERRYGLLRPQRTPGGFRLYCDEDAARILRMRAGLERGLAAAEAPRAALEMPERPASLVPALLAFDEERCHELLDDLLARLSVESVLRDAVLPGLRELGERWEAGEATVAQEHFAANLLRGRLFALARRWDQGIGRRALLACAPGDLHDLPLIAFGLALRARGWRILFLGADTPIDEVLTTAEAERPELVVLASSQARPELARPELSRLAAVSTLALAGRWPGVDVAAIRLEGDPVELAATLELPVTLA